jgi:transposase
MDIIEKTDYRKASPEAIYEARKIVIRMWKSKKAVAEIVEATGFSQDTVYVTIRAFKKGGMKALKPKVRGRKVVKNATSHQSRNLKLSTCWLTTILSNTRSKAVCGHVTA